MRGLGFVRKYADFLRNSGNAPTAWHFVDRKSAPILPTGCWICLNMCGFVAKQGELNHRYAFFWSKISTDLSCGAQDLRKKTRISTEKWERPQRSAFFGSEIGADLSCAASDLSEHERVCHEKVRTAPPLGGFQSKICPTSRRFSSCEVSDLSEN